MNHEDYMREALKEAETALREGNWPIGCIIELNGEIISRAHNHVYYPKKDRHAHAEVIALNQVKDLLEENKRQAALYVTYSPCMMCYGAAVLSRITKIIYGVDLDNSGVANSVKGMPFFYQRDKFRPAIISGVLERECKDVFMRSKLAQLLVEEGSITEF